MGVRGKNSSTELDQQKDFYSEIGGTLVVQREGGSSLDRLFQLAASLGATAFITALAVVSGAVLGCKEVSRITPYAFIAGIWLVHTIFAAVERGKHGTASKRKRKNKDPTQP